LSTTDGIKPWIAPLEYISDNDLNLYFFSPENAAHSQHLKENMHVAVAIFDAVQPEYEPAPVMRLAGLQIMATAQKQQEPYPPLVENKIEAWKLPMPPYAAYKVIPERWFVPVVKDGINERLEVIMG
jgi:hypothetical protein